MKLVLRKAGRTAYRGFIVMLWSLALLPALEIGEIAYSRVAMTFVGSYRTDREAALIAADEAAIAATAGDAPQPPPGLKRNLPRGRPFSRSMRRSGPNSPHSDAN